MSSTMGSRDVRIVVPIGALFAAGLAACALSGGACSAGSTADTPPLPEVAFEDWVKPPFMTVGGSRTRGTAARSRAAALP